jgi:glycyl-radical enzyme activating protein
MIRVPGLAERQPGSARRRVTAAVAGGNAGRYDAPVTPATPTRGLVFDIQRASLHDGPGIRTTVLLKGCPLRCVWCHNPESWRGVAELAFDSEACQHCLSCAPVCLHEGHHEIEGRHVYERRRCLACGSCAEVCPHGALRLFGRQMTADEVLAVVERDRPFYAKGGGGMTVSGGEPLSQAEFARELLAAAKDHAIGTCLDTSGEGRPEDLESLLPYADLVLFDYKATGADRHRELTGSDGTRILQNLDRLLLFGVRVILRAPLVPGVNDQPSHLDAIAGIWAGGGIEAVEVMPYHALGRDKRQRLGRAPGPEWPGATPQQVDAWLMALADRGCPARLG